MATYQIGRTGRLLVSEEATYGTAATLLATHAMRHESFVSKYAPHNRINSPEKKQTPGVMWRFDRRQTLSYKLDAFLRPSGTLGVLPECTKVLEHAFGTVVVGSGTVTYQLATDISHSLTFSRFFPGISFQSLGCVVDKLKLMFDYNNEAKFSAEGTGQTQVKPVPVPIPGFTTLGGNPPSGLAGGFTVNGVAYKIMSAEFDITNGIRVLNEDFGQVNASGYIRDKRRDIAFTIKARVTDDTTLYDKGVSGNTFALALTCGSVPGNIITVTAPNAQIDDVPDTPDTDSSLDWTFKGMCRETDGGPGNDELALIFT